MYLIKCEDWTNEFVNKLYDVIFISLYLQNSRISINLCYILDTKITHNQEQYNGALDDYVVMSLRVTI